MENYDWIKNELEDEDELHVNLQIYSTLHHNLCRFGASVFVTTY